MKNTKNVDILIVGAGLTGLCMANYLVNRHFNIALVDQVDPEAFMKSEYDGRTTAIAYGSAQILDKLGVWEGLSAFSQPITDIHVSSASTGDHVHYASQKIGQHPFGYIIENYILRKLLFQKLVSSKQVKIFAPSILEGFQVKDERIEAVLTDSSPLSATLCIAADGKNSALRQYVNIPATELPYNQTALVFVIKHEKPHLNRAFEHFLPTGPLAFLPMKGNKSSVVWSLEKELALLMLRLSSLEFAEEVQLRFGDVLGTLTLEGKIVSFPLAAVVSHKYIHKRMVFVGDAAHTIHPIAGQGFNLGLRDINALHDCLNEAQRLGLDLGSQLLLQGYQRQRRLDVHSMTGMTDSLVRLFSNNSRLLARMSGLGLSLTNRSHLLKEILTNHAMGLPLD